MPETKMEDFIMFNFAAKPPAWICRFLAFYGFQWQFVQKVWYAERTPQREWVKEQAIAFSKFPAPVPDIVEAPKS